MEAGSFPGPGQGGQHKVSSAGSWDSGLQCRQDSHGKSGMINGYTDRVNVLKSNILKA